MQLLSRMMGTSDGVHVAWRDETQLYFSKLEGTNLVNLNQADLFFLSNYASLCIRGGSLIRVGEALFWMKDALLRNSPSFDLNLWQSESDYAAEF